MGIENWSDGPIGGSGTVINKKFCIYGNLNIDVNQKFLLSYFYMQPNSSITMINGASFNSSHCTYYRCGNAMWQGIIVQNGSIYFYINKVYDAIIGVDVRLGQTINLFNANTFDRCYVGVSINSNIPIWEFVNNKYLCNGTLFSPYAGQISGVGMYLFNSIIREREGKYNNLTNGINSESSDLRINNNIMTNFTNHAISFYENHLTINNSLIRNCGRNGIDCRFGGITANYNQIYNALVGISIGAADYHFVNTFHNTMDSIRNCGILQFATSPALNPSHTYNEIRMTFNSNPHYDLTGIRVRSTFPVSGGFISNNQIEIPFEALKFAAGIELSDRSSKFHIENNQTIDIAPVVQTNDTRYGIWIRGGSNNEIKNNLIIGNRFTNPSTGILNDASNHNFFCCNTLENLKNGVEFTGACNATMLRKTIFAGPFLSNSLFFNNCVTGFEQIHPGNDWTGSAPVDALFVGSSNEAKDNPFIISNNTLPFFPDDPIVAPVNSWFVPDFSSGESHCNDDMDCPIIGINQPNCTGNGLAYNYPNDSLILFQGYNGPHGLGQTWQARKNLLVELIRDNNLATDCPAVMTFKNQYIQTSLGKLAQVSVLMEDLFSPSVSIQSQIDSLEEIISQAKLEITNADLQLLEPEPDTMELELILFNNLQLLQSTYLDLLNLIQSYKTARLATVNAILNQLNSIESNNILESNAIFVCNFQLHCILNAGDCIPTPDQLNQLTEIANQCPLDGGEAVYQAQELIMGNSPNHYGIINSCNETSSLLSSSSSGTFESISIQPNPNSGSFTITLPLITPDNYYQIKIHAPDGKLLYQNKYTKSGEKLSIQLKPYKGLIFLSLYINNQKPLISKILIQ